MSTIKDYKDNEILFCGWTRIEMMLALYDRSISNVENAKEAYECDDKKESFSSHYMNAQKTVLAIHSGLKPDEHEVAFNIARLLHFVLYCLEEYKFDDAIKVLTSLKSGFEQIRIEANELEHDGLIPQLPARDEFHIMA